MPLILVNIHIEVSAWFKMGLCLWPFCKIVDGKNALVSDVMKLPIFETQQNVSSQKQHAREDAIFNITCRVLQS